MATSIVADAHLRLTIDRVMGVLHAHPNQEGQMNNLNRFIEMAPSCVGGCVHRVFTGHVGDVAGGAAMSTRYDDYTEDKLPAQRTQ